MDEVDAVEVFPIVIVKYLLYEHIILKRPVSAFLHTLGRSDTKADDYINKMAINVTRYQK